MILCSEFSSALLHNIHSIKFRQPHSFTPAKVELVLQCNTKSQLREVGFNLRKK